MKNVTRRDFLKKSSCLTMAAAALGRSGMAFSSEPHVNFPAEPRARLAVASYPFRDYIISPRWHNPGQKQPSMELKDFGAMVVKKFNVKNVEPWSLHFASTDMAYVSAIREAYDKAGAHVIDIAGDIRHSVYDPNAANRTAAVTEAKTWVETAATLASPSVRIHVGRVKGAQPNVDLAADSLSKVADYGAEKNVVINLENDDPVSEDAFFIVKVIEKANHPWLHALPDFANSRMTHDDDFNYRAVTAMFKHAYSISHVKEGEDGPGGKFIPIDVEKTFNIAKAAGYRGYFSMEMDRKGDPDEGTQMLIDMSLKSLGQIL